MRLLAKLLQNVINVNHWEYANEVYIGEGNINEFYFQLVNLSKSPDPNDGLGIISEFPMRYISQASSISVKVFFDSIDDSEEFEVNASQPFSDDKSIWKITLSSSQVPKAGGIKITVTEDGVEKNFIIQSAIVVDYSEIGSC